MKSHELLEMAALDAMGLLDVEEREAFERAFRGAPLALQAQVRREQTRLALHDPTLPDVEPSISLRARVLAAIREAMESVRPRRVVSGDFSPSMIPSRGVNPTWRLAAVTMGLTVVVLAGINAVVLQQQRQVQRMIASGEVTQSMLSDFGAIFTQSVFDANVARVPFIRQGETRAEAFALHDQTTGEVALFVRNLPQHDRFRVVVLDENGNAVRDLDTFSRLQTDVHRVTLSATLDKGTKIAIVPIDRVGRAMPALLAATL